MWYWDSAISGHSVMSLMLFRCFHLLYLIVSHVDSLNWLYRRNPIPRKKFQPSSQNSVPISPKAPPKNPTTSLGNWATPYQILRLHATTSGRNQLVTLDFHIVARRCRFLTVSVANGRLGRKIKHVYLTRSRVIIFKYVIWKPGSTELLSPPFRDALLLRNNLTSELFPWRPGFRKNYR